jgi:hypothetical protein
MAPIISQPTAIGVPNLNYNLESEEEQQQQRHSDTSSGDPEELAGDPNFSYACGGESMKMTKLD